MKKLIFLSQVLIFVNGIRGMEITEDVNNRKVQKALKSLKDPGVYSATREILTEPISYPISIGINPKRIYPEHVASLTKEERKRLNDIANPSQIKQFCYGIDHAKLRDEDVEFIKNIKENSFMDGVQVHRITPAKTCSPTCIKWGAGVTFVVGLVSVPVSWIASVMCCGETVAHIVLPSVLAAAAVGTEGTLGGTFIAQNRYYCEEEEYTFGEQEENNDHARVVLSESAFDSKSTTGSN